MPPSGYEASYVKHLISFLDGCAQHLCREAQTVDKTPSQALSCEIDSITKELDVIQQVNKLEPFTTNEARIPTLELTRNFYRRLSERRTETWEQWSDHTAQVLRKIEEAILTIRIPS